MFSLNLLACITFLPMTWAAGSTLPANEEGFIPLFNGKDLTGWEGDTRYWSVRDGMLIGRSPGIKHYSFLTTTQAYEDFILRLQIKLVDGKGNSGVLFRSKRVPKSHEVAGYQADFALGKHGNIFDESRRRKVLARPSAKVLAECLKRTDWNDYEIKADDRRIILSLNGVRLVDYIETDATIARRGLIALQIHKGRPMEVRFRNIRLKETRPARQSKRKTVVVKADLTTGSCPAPAGMHGPLRRHAGNPRYFANGLGQVVYLTGTHTWNNLQYNGVYPRVDFDKYLDLLEAHHHNFIRMWAWEQGGWDPWAAGHVVVEPVPYARTGPGKALDGKPRYDVTQFNEAYFRRLRAHVTAAQARCIYVSVMLFQGWSVAKKGQVGNPWQGHPFNQANNINGINGDLNSDGQGPEIHTLQVPKAIAELQKAYVRQVIDTVNDLDNVLYEIGNEMQVGSIEWQYRMIEFIREYEKGKPKQHPIGMTGAPIANAALFDSPADWISPTGRDGYKSDPPPADGRKVIIADVDHIWPKQYRQWVWKSFTRGLNTAFMDLYGATKIGDKDIKSLRFVGDWINQHNTVRRNMGYTRRFAERMHLTNCRPENQLASSGFCLADPGREYLVYLPEGGKVRMDLTAAKGTLHVEWFDPNSGETRQGDAVRGGKHSNFTVPFRGDAVLYIHPIR
jgi:hypothetical protein